MPLRQCLRAGLQQLGAGASHPQLGAASHPQLGAGAGAAQHVGAGAGASQHVGAGASHPQLGAGSQQPLLRNLLNIPLILQPSSSLGLQTGAGSQQGAGAGASQHTGAGSQQAFFLQNKPAEALDDEIAAQTTTVRVMIIRRMELTPKRTKSFVNRAVNSLVSKLPRVSPVATIP
jgi:hypothetical protein